MYSIHAATDQESRALVERLAIARCGEKGCAAQLWVDGTCGALAARDDDSQVFGRSWGWGGRGGAEREALRQCGDACTVVAWICDERP